MANEVDVRDALVNSVEDAVDSGKMSGLKQGGIAAGIALGAIGLWEGGKWLYRKAKKAWRLHKDKKKSRDEEYIESDMADVDDVEKTHPIK